MGKFESYTEKTNPAENDLFLIGDSADTDSDGDYKTKRLKNSNIEVEGTKVKSTGEAGGTKYLREDGDGTCSWQTPAGGGGTSPNYMLNIPAGGWDYTTTDFAPWDKVSGTNGDIYVNKFDDSTEEYVQTQFQLPATITGTAVVSIIGFAATAAASKKVKYTFRHSAKASEDWDAAFTTTNVTVSLVTTQDQLDAHTAFSLSVSSLGWTANDHVRIRVSRSSLTTSNLSGDYYQTGFRISVPRA